ncbi:hypothetical protein SKAU_G00147180 [Synaphobranchus kaupii]|uniref:Uncharacterized protein n=1 Tax=Synaphobranchus kaupii TaxID=118154 RepID=A0A9Q1FTH5_SYNKA|nr:hypothetical protein SKAU_G00147180 [Synaphobranchus kaupii]
MEGKRRRRIAKDVKVVSISVILINTIGGSEVACSRSERGEMGVAKKSPQRVRLFVDPLSPGCGLPAQSRLQYRQAVHHPPTWSPCPKGVGCRHVALPLLSKPNPPALPPCRQSG